MSNEGRERSVEEAIATIIADVLHFEGYAPLKVATGCRRLTAKIREESDGWHKLVALLAQPPESEDGRFRKQLHALTNAAHVVLTGKAYPIGSPMHELARQVGRAHDLLEPSDPVAESGEWETTAAVLATIERCRGLGDDWDSYGAPAITDEVVDHALEIVRRWPVRHAVPHQDSIILMLEGSDGADEASVRVVPEDAAVFVEPSEERLEAVLRPFSDEYMRRQGSMDDEHYGELHVSDFRAAHELLAALTTPTQPTPDSGKDGDDG